MYYYYNLYRFDKIIEAYFHYQNSLPFNRNIKLFLSWYAKCNSSCSVC